jgi:hypothetical protein
VWAPAGGGGLGTSEVSALAGHCGALAEHCSAQVPVVSGGGWWTSERRCDGARRPGPWPTGDD